MLDGDFDRGRMEDALDDAGDGVLRAGDPKGDVDLADTTTARPMGETLWFTLDDDRLIVLVMAHADADSATANVDVVTDALDQGDVIGYDRLWSDVMTVESVAADGDVLVVTARPADIVLGRWSHVIAARTFPPG